MSRATSSATTVSPQQQQNTLNIPREKIAMRAYEKWCKRGRPAGTDKQDWIEAENELRAELGRSTGTQTGQSQTRR
jgi:hypothetical protein